MISPRHWCALLTLAGCAFQAVTAQEGTGATGTGTTGAGTASPGGASSSFGTGTTTTPGTTLPATSPTRPSRLTPGAAEDGTATGAASTFGTGDGVKKPSSAPEPAFSIPGAYGRPAQSFTAGEGRLARPKFRYTGTISFGYDDNVNQTPTNSNGIPDQVVTVLDDPGTANRLETGIGPNGEVMTVVVPGRSPTTRKVTIPGTRGQERVGSFLTRAQVGVDVQFASRKTLFTFDLRTGGDWYWDRPGKDVDYTGSIALMYLRRITPRLQFTATVTGSAQTQPDLTLVNTSTRQTGTYYYLTSRGELSYRLTPRFSVVGNINYSTIHYQESSQQAADNGDLTFGAELRYLFSPRFTLSGQVRYSTISYPEASSRDAQTFTFLLGGDFTLSRRFTATLLGGAAVRKFSEGSGSSVSPYAEMTLSYQLAQATLIRFNGRYGFESPANSESELVSFRAGLTLVQSFSPRLRGSIGTNFVRQTTTFNANDLSILTNTVDSTIGFEYSLTRKWTLNANYSYVTQFGDNEFGDFYRNQIFIGAEYVF